MKSYHEFFAELKRRKVFRVAGIYGIVSFGILQAADLMLPRLGLPDWTVTFMVAIVVLAFPVALMLAWAFEVTPDGVQRTDEAKPGELDEIVSAPATSRWPAGLLALVGVAALVLGAWWVGRRGTTDTTEAAASAAYAPEANGSHGAEGRLAFVDPSEDPRPSIAVLPFADMSQDGDQAYFSDGITEEILNTLAKIQELRVSARTSAFAYRNAEKDLREVGRDLGVEHILEGSVRKAGDQLRITAQLIDVESDSHLWSEQYDRRLDNIFQIQTEIAESIAEALEVPLGLAEGERLVTPTSDLETYDLYLAGRARLKERGSGVAEAVELFESVVARDSTWAPGWAGLAEAIALVPYYATTGFNPDSTAWATSLDAAERAARRALSLDPDNGSAAVALANALRDRQHWDEAEAAYLRATALAPDNVEAHQQYAEMLAAVGRLDEALVVARRALALDRSPIRLNAAGYIATRNGRFEEARSILSEGLRLDSDRQVYFLPLQMHRLNIETRNWPAFHRDLLDELERTNPRAADELRDIWPDANSPPSPAAIDIASEVLLGAGEAMALMAIGEQERAFEILENFASSSPPFGSSSGFLFSPIFDPIRNDPRFEAVLEARGLGGREPIRSAASGEDSAP